MVMPHCETPWGVSVDSDPLHAGAQALWLDRAGTLGDRGVGGQELVLRWGQWVEPLMSRGSELSARAPIPHQTSLIKCKFKDEIKNFKMVTTEH